MSTTSRRTALRLIGTAPLALGFAWTAGEARAAGAHAADALKAAAKGQAYKPKFFTPHEWEIVRVLVDAILPKDERSGSATEAGVPEFMDFLMTDPMEDERDREQRQTAMRGGLAWIDNECRHRFEHAFLECSETERTTLLDDIAFTKPDPDAAHEAHERRLRLEHGPAFFNSFRDLTASGFWSSELGMKDLGYMGNTFVKKWEAPPAEVLRKLGLEE
jgi:hypothetical protein